MPDYILTERQLKLVANQLSEKNLNEATGWNTFFDVVGIVDPTGMVDFGNGMSYISQGDYLFGFLSIVSAVPYLGDVAAKPVMAFLKAGGPAVKVMDNALKLSKAGKSAEALAQISKLKGNSVVGKFIESSKTWGGKLKSIVSNIGGPFKGLRNMIIDWITLFERAAKGGRVVRTGAGNLTKAWKTLSTAEKTAQLERLKLIAVDSRLFAKFKNPRMGMTGKYLFGAMPQLFSNTAFRSLARRTKWWLGLLDFIGVGNFVGPDELIAKMGEGNVMSKINDYQNTPEAKSNYEADFGDEQEINQDEINDFITKRRSGKPTQTTTPQNSNSDGGVLDFMGKIFGGNLRNAALTLL